jgi:uncharacterized membrane protein YedE/YeeE
MTEAALPTLVQQVLWAGFALGAAFGALAQKSHFCTMGAVADLFSMGDAGRMGMWVLAMGTAALGFNALVAAGLVEAKNSIYAGAELRIGSLIVGAVLFGIGMVLASGCGSKTLVRIGGGSLKSLVVFVVLGVTAYATLRGAFAVARVATLDTWVIKLPAGQDLPALAAAALGVPLRRAALVLGLAAAALAAALVSWRAEARRAEVWFTGIGVGAIVATGWWVTGVFGHLTEHPVTLEEAFVGTQSARMESLTFVAPAAHTLDWFMLFSDRSRVLSFGITVALGVIAGSAAASLASRRFRWEGFAGTEDTANHLVGAVLMGAGGVTALGCTVGQGISGVSTLAIGSFIALAGIIGGAVLALRYQQWRLERAA